MTQERDDFLKPLLPLWKIGKEDAVIRAFAQKFDLPESEVRWLMADAAQMIANGEV